MVDDIARKDRLTELLFILRQRWIVPTPFKVPFDPVTPLKHRYIGKDNNVLL